MQLCWVHDYNIKYSLSLLHIEVSYYFSCIHLCTRVFSFQRMQPFRAIIMSLREHNITVYFMITVSYDYFLRVLALRAPHTRYPVTSRVLPCILYFRVRVSTVVCIREWVAPRLYEFLLAWRDAIARILLPDKRDDIWAATKRLSDKHRRENRVEQWSHTAW